MCGGFVCEGVGKLGVDGKYVGRRRGCWYIYFVFFDNGVIWIVVIFWERFGMEGVCVVI